MNWRDLITRPASWRQLYKERKNPADEDTITLQKSPYKEGEDQNWLSLAKLKEFIGGGGTQSPLTDKGDLYTHDGADNERLAVGNDADVLSADSNEPTGLKWVSSPPPGPHDFGGASHNPDTLANVNNKITDATLDDVSGKRDPNFHTHQWNVVYGRGANGTAPGPAAFTRSTETVSSVTWLRFHYNDAQSGHPHPLNRDRFLGLHVGALLCIIDSTIAGGSNHYTVSGVPTDNVGLSYVEVPVSNGFLGTLDVGLNNLAVVQVEDLGDGPQRSAAIMLGRVATPGQVEEIDPEALPDEPNPGTGDSLTMKKAGGQLVRLQAQNIPVKSHTHAAADITSGTFDNARIAESNVTQHEAAINHNAQANWEAGRHVKNNFSATIDPGVNNDVTQGYQETSLWTNTVSRDTFVCTNSAAGAAVWEDVLAGGPGGSPLTTKGDLFTRDASADTRLPVGTNGQQLVADSAEPTGLRWANPTGGGNVSAGANLTDENLTVGDGGATDIKTTGIPVTGPGLNILNPEAVNVLDFFFNEQTGPGTLPGTGRGKLYVKDTNPTTILFVDSAGTEFDLTSGGYVHPNHTGDVTSVGDGPQTIANDAVTNAKLADMAVNTMKGTQVGGDPQDLTATEARALLNVDEAGDPRPPSAHSINDHSDVNTVLAADGHMLAFLSGTWVTFDQLSIRNNLNVDEVGTPRPPTAHNLAGAEHDPDTVANLDAKVTDGVIHKNTVTTVDPGVTDDANAGHTQNDRWFNTSTGAAFYCRDNTNGAAVWDEYMSRAAYAKTNGNIVDHSFGVSLAVTNNTGSLIPEGTPVVIDYTSLTITPARQDTKSWANGVVADGDIAASGGTGFASPVGFTLADTTGFAVGDTLYLGAVGDYANVRTEPDSQVLGVVLVVGGPGVGAVQISVEEPFTSPSEPANGNLVYTGTGDITALTTAWSEIDLPQVDLLLNNETNMVKSTEPGRFEFDYSGSSAPIPASIDGLVSFSFAGSIGDSNTDVEFSFGVNGVPTGTPVSAYGTSGNQTAGILQSAASTVVAKALADGDQISIFARTKSGTTSMTLDNLVIAFASFGGIQGIVGGETVHNDLTGRSSPDAHPIGAITGLQAALDDKVDEDPGVFTHTAQTSGTITIDRNNGSKQKVTLTGGATIGAPLNTTEGQVVELEVILGGNTIAGYSGVEIGGPTNPPPSGNGERVIYAFRHGDTGLIWCVGIDDDTAT